MNGERADIIRMRQEQASQLTTQQLYDRVYGDHEAGLEARARVEARVSEHFEPHEWAFIVRRHVETSFVEDGVRYKMPEAHQPSRTTPVQSSQSDYASSYSRVPKLTRRAGKRGRRIGK